MTDPDTLRTLEIADCLRPPTQNALRALVRALSPVAPAVGHLDHGIVQSPGQLRVAGERGEQAVDRDVQRNEAAGGA